MGIGFVVEGLKVPGCPVNVLLDVLLETGKSLVCLSQTES